MKLYEIFEDQAATGATAINPEEITRFYDERIADSPRLMKQISKADFEETVRAILSSGQYQYITLDTAMGMALQRAKEIERAADATDKQPKKQEPEAKRDSKPVSKIGKGKNKAKKVYPSSKDAEDELKKTVNDIARKHPYQHGVDLANWLLQ